MNWIRSRPCPFSVNHFMARVIPRPSGPSGSGGRLPTFRSRVASALPPTGSSDAAAPPAVGTATSPNEVLAVPSTIADGVSAGGSSATPMPAPVGEFCRCLLDDEGHQCWLDILETLGVADPGSWVRYSARFATLPPLPAQLALPAQFGPWSPLLCLCTCNLRCLSHWLRRWNGHTCP